MFWEEIESNSVAFSSLKENEKEEYIRKLPIVLLMNKIDLFENGEFDKSELLNIANKYNSNHYLISAKLNDNVKESIEDSIRRYFCDKIHAKYILKWGREQHKKLSKEIQKTVFTFYLAIHHFKTKIPYPIIEAIFSQIFDFEIKI